MKAARDRLSARQESPRAETPRAESPRAESPRAHVSRRRAALTLAPKAMAYQATVDRILGVVAPGTDAENGLWTAYHLKVLDLQFPPGLLGAEDTSNQDDLVKVVTSAWKKLSKIVHPDKHPSNAGTTTGLGRKGRETRKEGK